MTRETLEQTRARCRADCARIGHSWLATEQCSWCETTVTFLEDPEEKARVRALLDERAAHTKASSSPKEKEKRKETGTPYVLEYTPVDPLRLHPSTFELVQRHYWQLKDIYTSCTPIQQLYNTIRHFAPDLTAAVTNIQQATQQLLSDMRTYPEEAWKPKQSLPYLEEFCECVQETSARLHNQEPARRANVEALNQMRAESKQHEEEQHQRWLAEVAAGDAYFGGPGAYQRTRDGHYSAPTMKEYIASGDRLRAFREAYHRGDLAVCSQREPEPVQAELWEVAR